MDKRLIKRWEVLTAILTDAASEVIAVDGYSEYLELVGHNEFELALEVLEVLGDKTTVSWDFWWNLKKAAEVMGLRSHFPLLRDRLKTSRSAT